VRLRTILFVAAAVAVAAIALPIALASSGARHHSPHRASAAPISAGKLTVNSVSVANVDEADARLPFKAVLPSDATPAAGIDVPIAGKPSDSSGWLTADIHSDAGGYLLSESTSDATVETLQHWAAQSAEICSNCEQEVVTEAGVHVLVLTSPVFGLRLQWVRGDGAEPVLSELDWRTDMPAHNAIPSREAALAIAGDMTRQGG